MVKKFYVTTAIDYVNAEPHIGHAYQKIVADILARWHKLLGKEVMFLTGTDEYGKKINESAKKAGKETKEFVDEISQKFKQAWDCLNIKPTRFIRTTDLDHQKIVSEFILKCNEAGDIYKGTYEGYYCTNCEGYYTKRDAPEFICPIHQKPLEEIKEESYFFRLSKYTDFLLKHYEKNPEFIQPESRRNEIINRVKEGLKDLSISRTSFKWGIPFPLDKEHVTYVWFDALINYYTATREKGREKFWPADLHILGKDNTWFHTVYWPAMLKSAGIKLPKTVFNHGFLSFNGQKISKSLGNAISPVTLANKYGADSIRYFCTRTFPFSEGEDGDFSEQALIERHNGELANKLGNLISRVSALIEKYGTEKTENTLAKKIDIKKIEKLFEEYKLDKVLNEIFAFIDVCNEYVQEKKPWETNDKKILYELADSIKIISILLSPFLPETSEKISKTFGFKIEYKNINKPLKPNKIIKSEILFNKIGKPEIRIEGIMSTIEFNDWEKINLKVGKITAIEDIEGADKLYKISVDLGKEKRTICAGLKEFYKKEELINKNIVVVANLAPRKMRGIESQGMLLAAVSDNHKKVVLISPEKDIEPGASVS
jgi:methionyl-tRNA synthetase